MKNKDRKHEEMSRKNESEKANADIVGLENNISIGSDRKISSGVFLCSTSQ